MSALDQLEAFLQGLLERPAGLLMPKGVQPVQLVSALTKALEAGAVQLPDRIIIPSEFHIAVSDEDFAGIAGIRAVLERELSEYVERVAAERELTLPADPEVHIRSEPDVPTGHPHVETIVPAAAQANGRNAAEAIQRRPRGPALALLSPDGDAVRHFPLDEPSITLGRRSSNDISLPDLKLSRQHARFEGRGASWYLTDLHSTNGTRLNGRAVIDRSELHPGDIIELGLQRLRFEIDDNARERRN